MTTNQTSDAWTLRTVCFCLVATFLITAIVFALGDVAGMLWMGHDSFRAFRHNAGARPLYYIGSRLLALVVCVYFAKVRTQQDLVTGFALRPASPGFLMLAAMLGIWIAFFLRFTEPGGSVHHFRAYFGISSLILLVGPLFEETVMRGFFYPAFRNATPLAISILFAFVVDAAVFHVRTFLIPLALVGVGVVNVASCLLREHTKSLWPCIVFHTSYNLPFAILEWV